MDWTQFTTFMISNMAFTLTLWLWNRSESRKDQRLFEHVINSQLLGIREEMKDFHGRLCAIEEKNKRK